MTEEFELLYQLVFFSTAVALVLLERLRALQHQRVQIARRWTSNIGLFLIGSLVNTLVLPIGIYAFAKHQAPGLLSRLNLPFAAELLLTFLLLDLWRYWEHRLFHRVPLLWRLHLVHHSDTQVDVTTSERHHPLEFVAGTAVMMALIGAFGLPAPAVGLYLLVATVVTLYSHANLRLRPSLDRPLGRLLVTPAVHAVHHSDLQAQTDSNYGSVLMIWDRWFGTYVDPQNARIPQFGLGYFRQPRDMGLTGVLQQPFRFRREPVHSSRDGTAGETSPVASIAQPPRAPMTRRCKEALLGGIAGAALVSVAMWPTLLDMTATWRTHESYQYAWLVLPMVVYLLGWHHPMTDFRVSPRPDLTGIFVVVLAAACWGAAVLMNIDVGRQLALVLALQGVAMSTLGWRSYWRLFPTLALMFLMIPSGDLLEPVLRILTVKAIELFAVVAHLPHSVEGFVIFIGTHRYIVIEECSGLAFVTLGLFLGYSFGLLLYRSMFKIAGLALFGAFLGIVSNVLRVSAIVLIDWLRDSQMELTAHAGLFPQNLVGWELAATAAAWSVDESGRSESIRLSYRRNGREMQVAIVEPLSSDAKLAEAGLAPGDSRVWRQKQVQHEIACAVSGCIELSHSTWQRDKGHQLRHVYYAYTIGSFTTNSKLALRAMHGWQRLTGARDNRLLIGFISEDAASDIDELGAAFEVLQSAASESRGEVSSPRRVRQP